MSVTYNDLIKSVRRQAHLVGVEPFADADIFAMVKEALGDIFLGVTYLQERFWSNDASVTVTGKKFAKPSGLFRIIAITGTGAESEEIMIDKEAKYAEVHIERQQDTPANLYAFRGLNVEVSIDVPSNAVVMYIRDPCYNVTSQTATVDAPESMHGLIVQKAIAKAETHRDAAKSEIILRDYGYTMQRMKAGIETNEAKDRKRVNAHYDGERVNEYELVRPFDA